MEPLDLAELTRAAQEVAASQTPKLTVVGILLRSRESDYVELLLNIDGCRREPCQLEVGMFRNVTEAAMKQVLSQKLRQHLKEHHSPAAIELDLREEHDGTK